MGMVWLLLNDLKEHLEWFAAVGIMVVAFRHAGRLIAFLLDKLYQVFIQQS
jgi:hypothetical protein